MDFEQKYQKDPGSYRVNKLVISVVSLQITIFMDFCANVSVCTLLYCLIFIEGTFVCMVTKPYIDRTYW